MAVLCAPLMVLFAIVSIRRHADPEQVLPAPADALVSPDADQADLEDRFVSPRPPTPFEGDDKDQVRWLQVVFVASSWPHDLRSRHGT